MMMQLFPKSSTSSRCRLRLATPSSKCSPACALKRATLSSKDSSLKAGMYLAHSTRISNCCFMLSLTSSMFAICFELRSVSSPTFCQGNNNPRITYIFMTNNHDWDLSGQFCNVKIQVIHRINLQRNNMFSFSF